MDTRNARYVIMDMAMGLNKYRQGNQLVIEGTFFGIISAAGKDINMYFDLNNLPNEHYFRSMYSRLHVFDGTGLENYRMVYESTEKHFDINGNPTSNIKIFEYVKGAKITGNETSRAAITMSGTVITNQKRKFEYAREIIPDKNGFFEFTVPYSNEAPYSTRLLEDFKINYDNSTHTIKVSEDDVINGKTISVNR